MTTRQLTGADWFGTHTLAEDCTVPIVATRKGEIGETWIGQRAEKRILSAGTVLHMEHATSGAIFALLDGSREGIAIEKTAVSHMVVQAKG
ncbi:MAG: hypothetical protein PHU04_02495 [Candidatus Peribacteraceae bacterium]|nr:hypothetical protein [Candidatus Peribacteraceae bacterium]